MKKVILKQMKMLNFKGIRNLDVQFNEGRTSIYGCNGSGKTTVFDAFTWLMFGKCSDDRKVFNVKTLDANGKAIERIPHEVSATLMVDGKEITLCRRLTEKWVKRRGSVEEEFEGNKEERLFNDVPCSVKDWTDKINSICSEQVFKFITNPLYFSSQKPDVQRQMLIRMAGDIPDREIAGDNVKFIELVDILTEKTLDEYKREIGAKKKIVKNELEGIPQRIDERKRTAPEEEDWAALEAELKTKKERIAQIEAEMLNEAEAMKSHNEQKKALMKQFQDAANDYNAISSEIENKVTKRWYEEQNKRTQLCEEIKSLEGRIASGKQTVAGIQEEIGNLQNKKTELREQWYAENKKDLVFSESDFVCPTCGRPLEAADIEAKRDEMIRRFNEQKSANLESINAKGKSIAAEIGKQVDKMDEYSKIISGIETEAETKRKELNGIPVTDKPDATSAIESSDKLKMIKAKMETIEAAINEEYRSADLSKQDTERKALRLDAEKLSNLIAKQELIKMNDRRIAELEKLMKSQAEELARLEGIEFVIASFAKVKMDTIEERINNLFDFVRFKMYDFQINGGMVETCEATVNGVPYSDLNNAGKINAGLDIINAICKSEGISAPIFIDNAEAVNELTETDSQTIRLVVTEDSSLTFK